MHNQITYITIDLSKEDHREYYNGFANRVLWPILHYRVDLAEFSRRDLSGYRRVNAHFASQLHNVLKPDDVLWVHDLVGAHVVEADGTERGTVTAVEANPASDLLVLDTGGLVPLRFVVFHEAGRVVIDPPAGLFD